MKKIVFIPLFCLSCAFFSESEELVLVLPNLCPKERAVWGEIIWKVELFCSEKKEEVWVKDGESLNLELNSAPFAALAYPYQKDLSDMDRGMGPALSLPAGTIYPSLAKGNALFLTWEDGLTAAFFLEMLRREDTEGRRARAFNWPRFSAFLKEGQKDGLLPIDLWAIDLGLVAQKTLDVGFDRRRLKITESEYTHSLPVESGPWLADSPFLRRALPAGSILLRSYGEKTRFAISPEAIFRCAKNGCFISPRP